jgi:branched-subunit amino acid aminotransferase/4-amino-4-deoxychorismate lyase
MGRCSCTIAGMAPDESTAAEKVFLNGDIMPLSRAFVPVDDRGLLFGDSAFETMRAYGGSPFRLWRHLERLGESCRMLRLELPLSTMEITAAVALVLEENGLGRGTDSRVRITVTGGAPAGPKGLERSGGATLFITARPYEPPSTGDYQKGVALAISGIKRNTSSPLSSMKSGNYLDSLFARQEALDRGDDDAVMLTSSGNLSEATSSNIFYVKDGELATPNAGLGFLPGVTREAVLEAAMHAEIPCRLVTEGPDNLLSADEAFLTNSMFELMPVRRIGTHEVLSCPGPLTRRLHAAYRDLVQSETA